MYEIIYKGEDATTTYDAVELVKEYRALVVYYRSEVK